ncbi:MAG: hypothetical protein P8Y18_11310 [Candidatus Bathyarchaeota archaeon]
MDVESLANNLEELENEYNDLVKKIEAINSKLYLRKSILSFSGFFVLILFLSSIVLIGGIILTLISGTFNLYSELFSIILLILGIGWIVFIVISRINAKNISTNSLLRNKLSKQLEEINSKINKLKLLIDQEELKLKEKQSTDFVPETQNKNFEFNIPDSFSEKPESNPSAEVEKETKKEVFDKKKDDKLIFEEEQRKKGLVKFVPISLQIKELMAEEGHTKTFDDKISKKWKMSEDVPLEITWGTPEQVFEWTQKEKGYIKFIDETGKIKWGTEKQIAESKKEKTKKTRQ